MRGRLALADEAAAPRDTGPRGTRESRSRREIDNYVLRSYRAKIEGVACAALASALNRRAKSKNANQKSSLSPSHAPNSVRLSRSLAAPLDDRGPRLCLV